MKKGLLDLSKKRLVIVGVVVALTAGGVTAALNSPQQTGADTSPLTQEVDRQGEQLSNHEARISNTENDVRDLQDKTSTPPSSNRVVIPGVSSTTQVVTSTPDPAPAPAPAGPVKVISSSYSMDAMGGSYCHLTYSDGSTAQVNATTTVVNNGNSQSVQDNCQDFVGQAKN